MDFPIVELVVPVFEELLSLGGSFTDDRFNVKPAAGGWTAGQILQHIKLSAGNISTLLGSNTAETDRDPQEHIDQLRSIFMDFGSKMQAPAFIVPEDKHYDRDRMMAYFQSLKEEMAEIIENDDLSLTCLNFTMPGFPPFTRVEWLAFVMFHTQRHIHQLRVLSVQV